VPCLNQQPWIRNVHKELASRRGLIFNDRHSAVLRLILTRRRLIRSNPPPDLNLTEESELYLRQQSSARTRTHPESLTPSNSSLTTFFHSLNLTSSTFLRILWCYRRTLSHWRSLPELRYGPNVTSQSLLSHFVIGESGLCSLTSS
jgi:hypothetical protein